MNKRIYSLVSIFILVLLSIFVYLAYLDKLDSDQIVEIKRGSGTRRIASELEKRGIIRNKDLFFVLTVIKGARHSLKAGEYEFGKGESLNSILNKIIEGRVRLRKITIPEGKNIYEISSILGENDIADPEKFLSLVKDPDYVKAETGIDANSLEGYLFPDTYYFPKNAGTTKVVKAMTQHFFRVFNTLKKESSKSNLNDHDIVILASMIEKETGYDPERELISAVFYNRLRIGMKLDCDPTVIYGLGKNYDGNLTKKDMQSDNPYNTYKIRGLPPGPIANPGRESLKAALNPADKDYLYFVSKGDNTHVFSRTYGEHIRAVNKYIRNN